MRRNESAVRFVAVFVIIVYQKSVSPVFPPSCRYVPTCSQYAKEAIVKYGLFKGSYLAGRRLLRCHPFPAGGYAPVP